MEKKINHELVLMRLSGAEPISQVNYNGCLPVTYASRSDHGLEKCTQNSERSGIAYTIYTNQVNWLKNGRRGLKLVSNGGFEEMEHEFPFERFRPEKNRTTFSDFQLLPEIFRWNDPRRFVPFLTGFSGNFLKMVTNP